MKWESNIKLKKRDKSIDQFSRCSGWLISWGLLCTGSCQKFQESWATEEQRAGENWFRMTAPLGQISVEHQLKSILLFPGIGRMQLISLVITPSLLAGLGSRGDQW